MQQAITALGNNGFAGVYAANDGTAGGAIAAMKSAGHQARRRGRPPARTRARRDPADPRRRAVHDGLQGDQAGGRGARPSSRSPSPKGKKPPQRAWSTGKIDNGRSKVPSVILTPVAVTKDNVKDTVVKDGFWTAAADLHGRVRERLQDGGHPVGREPGARSQPADAADDEPTNGAPLLALRGRQQALRRRPGARRSRLRGPRRRGRRASSATTAPASRRWSRSISGIHAADDGRVPLRRQAGHDHARPQRRDRARDRDRLPGPRAVRQPRRRRQPLPRPRGDRAGLGAVTRQLDEIDDGAPIARAARAASR